ncbi:hypothetical protein D2912_22715 [Klebsiella pneumoniae]|nr:hypothetical protein [Klebsiella pneumoniae]
MSFVTGNWCYDRYRSVRLAIYQSAQSGLSSLKVLYYSAQLCIEQPEALTLSYPFPVLLPTLVSTQPEVH